VTTLAELQARLQSAVLTAHTAPALGELVSTPTVEAAARLGVYRDAYRLRLLEALEADFPMLARHLGSDAFEALGRAYIESHPSGHFSLRWYGEALPEWLAAERSGRPELAELAAFEWALCAAFDAADGPQLTVAEMAAVPPEQWGALQLSLHPSVQRRSFLWNVGALWNRLHAGEPAGMVEREERAVGWVFWRRDLRTWFRAVGAEGAAVLSALARGDTFGEICEALCRWHDEEAASGAAAGLLKGFIEEGLIGAIGRTG